MSNALKGIEAAIEEYEQLMAKVKQDLITKIQNLPDNDKIQRIGTNKHCFIINSSDLGNNWSVEYHDFEFQYRLIIKLIETETMQTLKKTMTQIIETGTVPGSKAGMKQGLNTFTFNPKVVEYLREM